MNPPSYPARPVNGGPFDKALPKSGTWRYEPKFNDWRAELHVPTGRMWERHGKPFTITAMFANAIKQIQDIAPVCKIEWLDVMALGRRHPLWRGTLVVLDLMDEAAKPYDVRRELMFDLFDVAELKPDPRQQPLVVMPPQVDPKSAWQELQQINSELRCKFYEGLVAKRADSNYPIQLRSPDVEFPFWMKHRWAY